MKPLPGRLASLVKKKIVLSLWPHATQHPPVHGIDEPLYRMYLEQSLDRGLVMVDTFGIDEEHLFVRGKILCPFGLATRYAISVGGREVPFARWEHSPALSAQCGAGAVFVYDVCVALSEVALEDGMALVRGHPGGSAEPVATQVLAIPLVGKTLPDAARRLRVHGTEERSSYLIQGATAAWKIRSVLRTHFGLGIADLGRVLDWGCGCGRVLQYLLDGRGACRLFGCDVDHDNIEWCETNLAGAEFARTSQQPPLPYETGWFDLVYGISVLTHLGGDSEKAWIAELHRVLKPGGIALLSVHGALTQLWHKPPGLVENLRAGAFMDAGQNTAFTDLVPNPGLYRDVIHTPKRIEAVWGPEFEVVDILPGFIGSLQDLVVLCRRS